MKIPRIVSFYWGGGPLSYLQYLTIVSFKKHNPGWKANLYMPKTPIVSIPPWSSNEQTEAYRGKDYLEKTKLLCDVHLVDFEELGLLSLGHEVHRSDLIRWKILHDTGGVWSDLDILYIKPLPKFDDYDAVFVFDGFHHIIGFYAAKPRQKIFKDIYKEATNRAVAERPRGYQSLGSWLLMKMHPTWQSLEESYPKSKFLNLPLKTIYPYDEYSIDELFLGIDKVSKVTVGIHWYNGSPIAKKYQNRQEIGNVLNSYAHGL